MQMTEKVSVLPTVQMALLSSPFLAFLLQGGVGCERWGVLLRVPGTILLFSHKASTAKLQACSSALVPGQMSPARGSPGPVCAPSLSTPRLSPSSRTLCPHVSGRCSPTSLHCWVQPRDGGTQNPCSCTESQRGAALCTSPGSHPAPAEPQQVQPGEAQSPGPGEVTTNRALDPKRCFLLWKWGFKPQQKELCVLRKSTANKRQLWTPKNEDFRPSNKGPKMNGECLQMSLWALQRRWTSWLLCCPKKWSSGPKYRALGNPVQF